jgi:CRP/FNR family transcriptional regulator, cyclic AMP receptor protein
VKHHNIQVRVISANRKSNSADWESLVGFFNAGTLFEHGADRPIFRQGESADSVFHLRKGKVRLSVTSQQGKEAIVAILGPGEFFGEGCLADQSMRVSTAVAITDCILVRIERSVMARMLHERHDVSELFLAHLLSRNIRYEDDLVDQLFNSSEKRLARALLLLAHLGSDGREETILPGINQEHLAQMVGTTRSRVSHFMNKFRGLGLVEYTGSGLTVNSGLLSVMLHDEDPVRT